MSWRAAPYVHPKLVAVNSHSDQPGDLTVMTINIIGIPEGHDVNGQPSPPSKPSPPRLVSSLPAGTRGHLA
jgi:hypothetical protein